MNDSIRNRLILGAITSAAALFASASLAVEGAGAAPAATDARPGLSVFDLSDIAKKAEACSASPAERKFDQIGWATRILDAEKIAREHNRPVFLFTHDGRIATGRC